MIKIDEKYLRSPKIPPLQYSDLEFTQVTEKAMRIAIVASGPSLRGFSLEFDPSVTVIAINSTLPFIPKVDFWFTLDPSPVNRTIMANPRPGVKYYAAVPETYGSRTAPSAAMQWPVDSHVKYLRRVTGNAFGRLRAKAGLSQDRGAIHTGNSAWGGFQLAHHMDPDKIALFGVDGYGPYFFGGKPRCLSSMKFLFSSINTEVLVVNGSLMSKIRNFPQKSPADARAWLES